MIEKLNVAYIQVESDGNAKLELANKINELVDAVNDLQNRITALDNPTYHEEAQDMYDNAILGALKNKQVDVVVEPAENVQDKFAEQRKWVGKLCRFYWGQGCYYGILTNIKRKAVELRYESNGRAFRTCEPVKPDDDIIYKGE